jgi:hypothetical protein
MMTSMGKRSHLLVTAALFLSLAFLGLGVGGCFATEAGRESELRDRVEELIPAEGHVLAIDYGDCVELAASPSCARVVFEMPERDSAVRAALVRTEAKHNGWTITHSGDTQGGWSIFAKRKGYTAMAVLWRSGVYDVDCDDHPDPRSETGEICFNTLNVER